MEWISVEDRLPDDSREVLICTNEHVGVDYCPYQDPDDWYFNSAGQSVTHWMKLPEPPAMKEG